MTIPDSWAEVRLGDVAGIVMGQSPKGTTVNESQVGTPLVGGAANLKNGKVITNKFTTTPTKICEVGDFIYCVRATIGKIGIANKKYCLGRGVAGITPKINSDYLRHYLVASEKDMAKQATGSTFAQIDKKTMEDSCVPLPPLAEQKRIVAKIEACFTQAEAIAADLNKARVLLQKFREAVLAKAFAGELVTREPDTEWQEVKLGDVCAFEYGKPLKKENRRDGNYPVFGSNGIVGYHDSYLVKAPFIVVGRKGSAGAVNFSNKDGFPIDTTFYIQSNDKINLRFLYLKLMSLNLGSVNEQSAVPGLNRNDAYKLKVPLPPLAEQKRIVAKIEACYTQADAIAADINKARVLLQKFREAVLAKAFQGELVLQDASEGTGRELVQKMTREHRHGQG